MKTYACEAAVKDRPKLMTKCASCRAWFDRVFKLPAPHYQTCLRCAINQGLTHEEGGVTMVSLD